MEAARGALSERLADGQNGLENLEGGPVVLLVARFESEQLHRVFGLVVFFQQHFRAALLILSQWKLTLHIICKILRVCLK